MNQKTPTLLPSVNSEAEKEVSPLPKRKPKPRERMAVKGVALEKISLSPEDHDLLQNRWRTDGYGYVFRLKRSSSERFRFYMHQEICRRAFGRAPVKGSGEVIDHINQDKLDNRRSNLRIVSVALNNANKPGYQSGYKTDGRFAIFRYGKWQARVTHKSKTYYLGTHSTYDEARAASLTFIATIDRPQP